jgi:tRNA threonylcarbamoyladenosine biosynthesis protein TsaB
MDPSRARILLIETSGRAGRVGLAVGDSVAAETVLDPARRHGQDLAPAIQNLLTGAAWAARDVAAVFVSRGPGSYTGLRVGVMAAKAFAYATRCDLLAVDTFAAIAARCPPTAQAVEVVADAQRGLLYVQRFERTGGGGWVPASALSIAPINEWAGRPAAGVLVAGPGLPLVERHLPQGVTVAAAHTEAELCGLLAVGLGRSRRGDRDDPWQCEPLYLRRSAAEENWARNNPQARRAPPHGA